MKKEIRLWIIKKAVTHDWRRLLCFMARPVINRLLARAERLADEVFLNSPSFSERKRAILASKDPTVAEIFAQEAPTTSGLLDLAKFQEQLTIRRQFNDPIPTPFRAGKTMKSVFFMPEAIGDSNRRDWGYHPGGSLSFANLFCEGEPHSYSSYITLSVGALADPEAWFADLETCIQQVLLAPIK